MNKDMIMWIQNGDVVKGEIDFEAKTVTFYDKFDNILVHWSGLSRAQLVAIKKSIQEQLAKRKRVGFYYV